MLMSFALRTHLPESLAHQRGRTYAAVYTSAGIAFRNNVIRAQPRALCSLKLQTTQTFSSAYHVSIVAMAPFTVRVHPYDSPTRSSCAYEIGPATARNALVFIGGLTDGPHTVPSVHAVSKKLEEAKDLSYSVFEFRMRSSFIGFGISSLANDVADISALVKYLRGLGKEKIVLSGHSTGCQVISSSIKNK